MIKSVLVTGGAGYVGSVLIPKLLQIGYQVHVLDWFLYNSNPFSEQKGNKNLVLIKGDIRDNSLLRKHLHGVDAVIHLACISNDPSFELDPTLGKTVNFDATKSLIDISKDLGVKRFIYASSSSVYGVKVEDQVTEELSLEPLTDYSKYKALGEDYLLSKKSDLFTVLVLRPATVCGYSPRMRFDLTVNMLTIQALVNKRVTVFGGQQLRPNIHIQDMTDLYVRCLSYENKQIQGKIYNAGYENYSVSDIADMVKKTVGDNGITIVVSPSNDLRSYKVSSQKIQKELGFKATHSVEEAIKDIVDAYTAGKFSEPLSNPSYYNITMMQNEKELIRKSLFD